MIESKKKGVKEQKTSVDFRFGIIIFIFAFFLRLVYLWHVKDNILIQSPVSDSGYYFQRATEILNGTFIGAELSFHSALLYPFFLAPLLTITQNGLSALFFQILVGSSTCFLIYLIGRKIFNEFSGRAAGFIAAIYGFFIFIETQFLADFLIPFFLCIMLVVILYAKNKFKWFFVGILVGFSALCRTTTLIFVPFLFLFLFLDSKKIRTTFAYFGLLLLGILLPMLPFSFINYKTVGNFSPIPSGGGVTFYVGNNADATGGFSVPKEIYPYYNHNLPETSKKVAEINSQKKMTSIEASTFWFEKTIDFIRNNPLETLRLMGKKFILFWNKYESTCILDFYFFKENYSFLKFTLSFGLFVPLGLLGIVLSNKRSSMILHFLLISTLLTTLIFFVLSRFRLPATMVIIIFAGYALCTLWSKIKKREWQRTFVYCILLLCFYVFVNVPEFKDVKLDPGYIHSLMSAAYGFKNDTSGQIRELQKCLEVSPRYPFVHARLGDIYWELGHIQASISEYEKEIQINPKNAVAHEELGRRYGMTENYQKAREQLEIAIEMAPMMIEARINLGIVYRKLKRYDKAIEEFQRAFEIDSTSIEALLNIGNVYLDKGNIDSAIVAYKKALDQEPSHPEVRLYLSTMIQQLNQGKTDN
jgi:Tfp pilus assembly protein PilF/4-amino-4-deoxy-L-arabinose transferase-like glycosyltransferase